MNFDINIVYIKFHAMKLKRNIAVSETGFVFNPSSGDSFSVNPVGLEIMNLLKQHKSEEVIRKHILEKYQVENDQVEKDYYDFIKMLETMQLTEKNEKEKN